MSTDPRTQPLFLATADPSLNPATEGSLDSPAMTLDRAQYISVTSGGAVADVNPPEAYPVVDPTAGGALHTRSFLYAYQNVDVDPALNGWTGIDAYFYDSLNGFIAIDPAAGEDRHTALVTAAMMFVREDTSDTMAPWTAVAPVDQRVFGDQTPPVQAANLLLNSDVSDTWDRARAASAETQSAAVQIGVAAVALVGNWSVLHAAAVGTQATATRAAGGAGVRHVATTITAKLVGVAAIAAPIAVVLRDGATGVGAIIWAGYLFAPAAGSKDEYAITGLSIPGSANTAMTLEFAAAPGAGDFESVALTGYSVA